MYQKRKRDASTRIDQHLGLPSPVSDNNRFIRATDKINMLQGRNRDFEGLDTLLSDVRNPHGINTLKNTAIDFGGENE